MQTFIIRFRIVAHLFGEVRYHADGWELIQQEVYRSVPISSNGGRQRHL